MGHRAIPDRSLLSLITGILVLGAGCNTSSADGLDAKVSERKAEEGVAALGLGDGQQSANVPRPTCAIPTSTTAFKLDTSLLREIEQRVLPPTLVAGPHRHATLPEYYWAGNPELLFRLRAGKAAFDRSPQSKFQAITLVAGAAGVGKTFLKGEVFSKQYSATAICKFDIRELYDEWATGGVTVDKPDLSSGDLTINCLKSVSDKNASRLREYLEAQNAAFYVIDSLDEIHPDDYAWVLGQVEDFVFHRNGKFTHVVVFGRGFAFRDFWRKRTDHRAEVDIKLCLLEPPTFRTTGDLIVSSWNYHSWKYDLAWAPDGNEADKMPLVVYAQWIDSGFSRKDEFRSITCEDNDDMRTDVQSALSECADKHRVVCSTLYNLAGNSIVREILRRETLEQHAYDERRIADAYLDAWLIRETKPHGRPSAEKPEHLDLYLSLFELVAAKSLQDDEIDSRGYFPIADSDTVTVTYRGRQQTYPIKRILDRSGLVVTDPRESGVAKYRFEPIWMHRLLAEKHCERMAKERRLALGTSAN